MLDATKQATGESRHHCGRTPRVAFDSRVGISQIIKENGIPKALEILCSYRKTFFETHHKNGIKLLSFIVDGKWLLNRDGKVYLIKTDTEPCKKNIRMVMMPEEFMKCMSITSYEVEEYL